LKGYLPPFVTTANAAGMLMPAASALMPMPSYGEFHAILNHDLQHCSPKKNEK
jgi:hypothetical protein